MRLFSFEVDFDPAFVIEWFRARFRPLQTQLDLTGRLPSSRYNWPYTAKMDPRRGALNRFNDVFEGNDGVYKPPIYHDHMRGNAHDLLA
jgi:hypothetical protein